MDQEREARKIINEIIKTESILINLRRNSRNLIKQAVDELDDSELDLLLRFVNLLLNCKTTGFFSVDHLLRFSELAVNCDEIKQDENLESPTT